MKSLRDGRVSLAQAWADVRDGELWLLGADIAVYEAGTHANHEPTGRGSCSSTGRDRLADRQGDPAGPTLVPLRLYFKDGRVKLELALARGKSIVDKRRDIASRDARAGRSSAPSSSGADPAERAVSGV